MLIYSLALFALGSCLGSFLNVVIVRSIASLNDGAEKFTVSGRSFCPHCRQTLRWWELIPIVSFLFLRGRCARCGQSISWQYPFVELAMGVIVVLLATPLPFLWPEIGLVALKIIIAALILVLFVIDLKTMLLPDAFVSALLVAVVAFLATNYQLSPAKYQLLNSIGGALLGSGFLLALWALTRGRGVGLGDVKLMVPLGLLFGLLGTGILLWLAYVVGGLLALFLLLQKKATLKTAVPFGPFLCGAAVLLLVKPDLPAYLLHLLIGYNPWP